MKFYGFFLSFLSIALFSQDANAQYMEKIEAALPAVVTVVVEKQQPIGKKLLGFRGQASDEAYKKMLELSAAMGSGSGFVIEQGGKKYVITNAHVVEQAADDPESIFVYSLNRTKYPVRLLGGDSFYDVAVLEFLTPPGKEIGVVAFAEKTPKITERVFAVGNPLGEFPYTITDGIVSALNRSRSGVTGKFGYIQTTATMIWGNSGGPLLNEKGEVVGINSQIEITEGPDGNTYLQQQINFSLDPVIARIVVSDIIRTGKRVRAYLGLEVSEYYHIISGKRGLSIGEKAQALPVLSHVFDDSPGFSVLKRHVGSLISTINGTPVTNLVEVLDAFEQIKPGEKVTLKLVSGGKSEFIDLKAAELKSSHLEELALHVLRQNDHAVPVDASVQVRLQVTTETQSPLAKGNLKQYATPTKSTESYFVVAAGVAGRDASNMWAVTTYADLGAALRIYGLRGAIEYMLVSSTNKWSEPFKMAQIFSNREQIFQSIVWY